MKTKLLITVCAVAVSALALICSNTVLAQRQPSGGESNKSQTGAQASQSTSTGPSQGAAGVKVATPITPQDAAKKYPTSSGRYPMGERDAHDASGIVRSPYPPHEKFDCSQIAHGALAVDTRVNKVFVRP